MRPSRRWVASIAFAVFFAGCASIPPAQAEEARRVESYTSHPPPHAHALLRLLWSVVRERLRGPVPEPPVAWVGSEDYEARERLTVWLERTFDRWWRGPGGLAVLTRIDDLEDEQRAEVEAHPENVFSGMLALAVLYEFDVRAAVRAGIRPATCDGGDYSSDVALMAREGVLAAERCLELAPQVSASLRSAARECERRRDALRRIVDGTNTECDE